MTMSEVRSTEAKEKRLTAYKLTWRNKLDGLMEGTESVESANMMDAIHRVKREVAKNLGLKEDNIEVVEIWEDFL